MSEANAILAAHVLHMRRDVARAANVWHLGGAMRVYKLRGYRNESLQKNLGRGLASKHGREIVTKTGGRRHVGDCFWASGCECF